MANDIFNQSPVNVVPTFTADKCEIIADGKVFGAVNVSVQYSRSTIRRRAIGSGSDAVMVGTFPVGQIQMSLLMTPNSDPETLAAKFDGCSGQFSQMTFILRGCEGIGTKTYTAKGCTMSAMGFNIDADQMLVFSQVSIDFMQLFRTS